MGEIRVKSENLFDISKEIKNEGLAGSGTTTVSSISNHSDYIAIRPDTSYTINHDNNDSVNRLIQFFNRHKTFVMEIYDNVTFPNTFTTPSNAYFMRFAYSNHATNITLVEGSTALPYQPYFLNLPAHEKTSTGWKDIPTHTMTANGWHGELTSQSPLEFKATGQSLLDWRVDGRTSENLFDIGTNVDDYERPGSMVSVTPSAVAMKLENSGLTVHYRLQNITTTGTVTIYCKGSVSMPRLYLRLRSTDDTRWLTNSDVSISGMVYNSVFNGWFNDVFSNIFIKTIVIPDCLYWNLGLGFNSGAGGGGQVGNTVSIINPIVVKGTYTPETIPPYEPYGGVGDWDETEQKYVIPVTVGGVTTNLYTTTQLMDGDSLDFATDQTSIPITQGDNMLTVGTAVQPKSVFVKFEG